jgi:hypothetical protein
MQSNSSCGNVARNRRSPAAMQAKSQQGNITATQHKADNVVHNIIVLAPDAWQTDRVRRRRTTTA